MVKSMMTETVPSSGRGRTAAAMAQNEETTEEHSTMRPVTVVWIYCTAATFKLHPLLNSHGKSGDCLLSWDNIFIVLVFVLTLFIVLVLSSPWKIYVKDFICFIIVFVIIILLLRYEDSVDNTGEENSSVFSLVWMRWLPSARACGQ